MSLYGLKKTLKGSRDVRLDNQKVHRQCGSLLFYDTVSGKQDQISTEPCNQTVICPSIDKLFIISVVENKTPASLLSLLVHKK